MTIRNSTCHYIRGPNGYVPQSSISEAARTPNTAQVAIGLTVFVVFVMQTIYSYGIVGPKYVREYNNFLLQWRKMSAMASQITSPRLITQPFIQAQFEKNIKAPRHWPLWGEFTGDRWIPRTKDQ